VDLEIGTFSKAFGVVGGVVAGKATIIEWLRQRGRPFVFSSAVTPADAAATIEAITLLEESTELVDRLWENAAFFKKEMKTLGFDTGVSATPITPIMLGEAPLGKARLRVMISAAHQKEDLEKGLEAFTRVGRKLGVIQ
jgi:glycine C-acetyltransferase